MWVQALLVVVFFLAIVSSLIALARHWPGLQEGWRGSLERARNGPRTSPRVMVRPDTDQISPDRTGVSLDQVAEFLRQHNLTDEQLIMIYALPHRAPDDYPMSANKIRDAVGGSRDEVLAAIAAHRPKPKVRPPRRLERPANGW